MAAPGELEVGPRGEFHARDNVPAIEHLFAIQAGRLGEL